MASFDDQEDPQQDSPSSALPPAPRRIGYSSRGQAGPVGETVEEPPLVLPGAADERTQQAEATGLRRAYQARKQEEATLAKKTVNAQREAEFRTKGQKFYADSFGNLQPEVDEQGKPRFAQTDWKKGQVDTKDGGKQWALTRRNESGQIEARAPKLVTSGDLKDPNLYHDFGGLRGEREVAGHVDDLAQSADPETATAAAKYRDQRNKAIRAASVKPLNDAVAGAEVEIGSAQLKKDALETRRAKLTEQISALDSNPAIKQTAGGFIGIGAEPTEEAKRLQSQRAALQAEADSIAQESTQLDTAVKTGGALHRKHEQAKVERDLWVNETKLSGLDDQAETRRAWLKKQGRPENGDPVLAQILAKQEEFGVKSSRIASRRATDDQLAQTGQAEGEALNLSPAQLDRRARDFTARRNLNEQHLAGIDTALKDGERSPEIQAEMQKAETERRALLLEQNRLTAAQRKLVEKQTAERTAAIAGLSDAELMAGVDSLAADLKERQGVVDRYSSDQRIKKDTVARVATLRDQAQSSYALLDAERKRRGLAQTPAEAKADKGIVGDTKDAIVTGARGVLAGAGNINRFMAGVLATGGDLTGWDWLRDSANEFSEAQKGVVEERGPAIATLNDVDSVASAFKYVSGQIGTQAPIFGAAAAAGIMAKGVAMIPSVGKAISTISGAKKAGNAALATQQAARFTETAANLGTGVALQTGSIQSDLLDLARDRFAEDLKAGKAEGDIQHYRDRYVQPLPILTLGLATGLLEGLSFNNVLKTAGMQKQAARGFFEILEKDGIGRRVLKSVMAAEASEIPTELLQTLGERLATKWVDPESKYFTPELADALRETAAATLVSTGPIGALGGIRKPVNDSAIEDAVRAIEQVSAVGKNLRDLDQWQQEELRRPAMELIPAARIAEVATAAADNPQDAANAAAVADVRQRADDSTTAVKQIAEAPDFVAIDLETGEPINDPTTLGANRDAARALVKVANGYAVADLTEAEAQGLATIGEQLGSDMVRDVSGEPVITDKAREWAVDLVPAAGKLIRQTETERLAGITAAAQAATATPSKGASKSNEKDQIQKEKGLLKPTPSAAPAVESSRSPAAGASASISFTNDAGKTERVVVPAGATVPSSGAPVRDQASAEQYLAETSKTPVRDVQFMATQPGKPAATSSPAPTVAKNATVATPSTTVAPGAIMPHLVKRMRAAGADNKAIASAAQSLAKRVNTTVARYSGLFGGRVTITDKSGNSGGVAYDSDSDSLIVSTTDLGRDVETLAANPDRLEKIIREEAIHRAAVRLEKSGAWKADALWKTLTPATRDAFIRAYNQGRGENEGARTTGAWSMGHEMVRMLVQGRLAVENGRLTLDGAAISEETASPTLLAKIADILTKIRDYFTDLAGQLTKDGNDPAAVAEVNRVVDLITRKLQALEKATAAPSPDTVAENTAETIEGQQIKGEWVAFAPESGTLGIPRTEMPQFQNEHLGALTQFLAARGITHTTDSVLPGTLKPSQAEYSTKKAANVAAKAASGEFSPRSILVSSDGYILDRHHQFVAALTAAPETPIPVIRFSAPIRELFDVVHDFPSVEYSKGAKSAPAPGRTETAPAPSTREPSASQNANATSSTQPDAGGRAPAPSTESAVALALARDPRQLALALGVQPAQLGSLETVTHKGRTVRVINLVVDVADIETSHSPDGAKNPDFPNQELQPRDRSAAVYRDQQRRIAANPSIAEDLLTGTPDRGTPIVANIPSGGPPFVLIGNGRANAKALMYASPDLAEVAAKFKRELAANAAAKGLTAAAVEAIENPVFVRHLLDPLSVDELRAFSQASNEFSGAATNAVEQAKVDASRLTPATLAAFDPEFDLDSAKNESFRREFVRSVIGRAENITGPDLRRRVQAALFAKAFGDTDAGMAAFSRLAGEDDEGTRNLVRAMLDVAPAFAAMRAQIDAGNLHPLDLAPALTRAVQEIAVALREKPAAQSVDVALDGLVNQADLALDGARAPLDDTLLRFLVANRRNRADLIAGLNAYVAGVYAAGDPKQTDMFGAEPPTASALLRTAVEDPQAGERALAAAGIGRVLASGRGEEIARGMRGISAADYIAAQFTAAEKAAIARYEAQIKQTTEALRPQWSPWYETYRTEAPRFANGTRAVARATNFPEPTRFYTRKEPKSIGRIVEKALHEGKNREFIEELRDIKDTLGATFVVRTRADYERAQSMLVNVFGLDPDALDIKDTISKPWANGYLDIKIRPEIRPGIRAEVIFITPEMHAAKTTGPGHVLYELDRTITALTRAYEAEGMDQPLELHNRRKNEIEPAATWLYTRAWESDSTLFSQSARDISGDQSQANTRPAGNRSPSAPKYLTPPSLTSATNGISSRSSRVAPTKNSSLSAGGSLSSAFIAPTPTNEQAIRQPTKITAANISGYSGNVDVSAIRGRNGDLWVMFDRSLLDPQTGRLVPIDRLISTKDELRDPKFLAGKKKDPRQYAADAMGYSLAGDPRNEKGPRAPLDAFANADGTFTIIDGNATAQAAMLAGWKTLPVNVRPKPAATLSSAPAADDLFGGLLGDYAQALPPKAKRNKAEAKKLVAKELPALPAAAFDDLFSLAQAEPGLTNDTLVRSGDKPSSQNENDRRPTDTPRSRKNGGRAFEQFEPDDLGSLFGNPGPASAPTDAVQPDGTPNGNVAGTAQSQPDSVPDGSANVGQEGSGLGTIRDDATGSLSVTLPGDRDRAGGRADARAAAEARRLARIARSRALGVNEQNHRIADGDTLVERGNKTRLRGNVAAIRLLRTLQQAKRNATPEEKRTLAKYVGWGALSQVFDRTKGEAIEAGELDSLRAEADRYEGMSTYGGYYRTLADNAREKLKALENWDNSWGEGYRALKEILTPEEWEAARNSTENAHYTDRNVIGAMWQALDKMGFKGGRVLEPAGGVGHFFGLMPEETMRASELFGVELDSISGGIFAALYPAAQVQTAGFEKARLPDNAFDLVVSNVPFSEVGPFDPVHEKAKLNLHNYFFAKALDKARPGGLVAFITTSNTMEASPRQRAYLAELGDFVGAVRLPNDAFAANAGTQVTTDIVFMRKRDGVGSSPFAQAWQQKEKVGDDTIPTPDGGEKVVPITVNEYFAKNPAMVLGTHSMNGSMYAGPSTSGQYTVNPTPGDLAPKLAAALEQLPAAYTESGEVSTTTLATTSTAREGAFSEQNGELGIYRSGEWKPLAEAAPEYFGEGKIKFRRKAAQFVKLRDTYREHLATMAKPTATAAEITRGMQALNQQYDAFVSEWGTLEQDRGRHKQLKSDPAFYLLKGLERVEEKPNLSTGVVETKIVKADVLSKRTIFPSISPTKADNALDALRISQSWKGSLDLGYMAELLDQEPAAVKQQLIEGGLAYENPRSGLLETKEAYLSGRVREKLRQAEAAVASNPDYARNVEALRAVQPPAVPPRHVTPKLGGGWVPPALLEAFLRQVGFGDVKVRYTQIGDFDKWTLAPSRSAEYSTANARTFASGQGKGDFTGLELLAHALDQKTPQAFDTDEKTKKRIFNAKRTAAANAALTRLIGEWEKFAKGDAEVTITLDGREVTAPVSQITADAFNETFNGTVPRSFDGSHLTLPGSAPFLLGDPNKGGMRPHQKNGIWRAVQEGVAFLAHGVGAGKTRELIAIAMEWKRLGLAKKPMLVVHNPTLNQFANETRKIYPGARVLVATKDDLQKENRRAFAARVASGDWDLVVIAHSSFNLIDDDPAVVTKFVNDQKADVEAALASRLKEIDAKTEEDREAKKDPTVKQLVKMLRALEARLLKASQLANKDDAVLFQELGVDGLLIDEAHMFKKVPFVSKMGQVAGLDMSSSARASNLLMRLNDVRAKNNGRNVVLATGTPITNTLAEVWNMIRLTSPQTLKEFGVPTFDQFSAAFGQVVESLEMNPAGRWVPRRRFAKFVNGTGLAAFIRSIMDVQLNLDLGQPQIANGGLTPIVTKRTKGIDAYMAHLEGLYDQWQKLEGEDKQLYSAIPLVISGVAKAATMDMRLIDPTLPDDPNSKVNRAIEKVVEFYNQETERKGTQIVFADQYRQISTDYLDDFANGKFVPPTAEDAATDDEKLDADGNVIDATDEEGGFNLYRDIKAKLIARGIPAEEIAIASDYNTDLRRADLFAKMNAGFIRIALGSTQKMGVGVNVQERLYALHHLDTPWTPADLEQRIGRAWRSGNRYTEWGIPIQNLGYGVERTMDAGRYQVIETKSRFVKQAMEGKSGFEFEDPAGGLVDAAAELKAQFTSDPRVMEMVSLENQVRELELQADAHDTRRREFAGQLAQMQANERAAQADVTKRNAELSRLQAIATQALTPADLEDIDARIDLATDSIIADGALQSENARRVWDRILAPGITLSIFAKGELRARPAPKITSQEKDGATVYSNAEDPTGKTFATFAEAMDARPADTDAPITTRVNAILTLDGESWHEKGITSDRSKGIPVLFARSVARAESYVASAQSIIANAASRQADARTEMERPFEAAAELARKKARLAELNQALKGGGETTLAPLADGTGPRGTMPALASGRATVADPNQLEFEEITAEEMAAVDRALADVDRATRVKDTLPVADKIAAQFRIPGLDPADVRQEARASLITAARSYETARGAFAPYAGTIIRNHLRDLFNREVRRIRTQGLSTDVANDYGSTIADLTPGEDNTRTGAEVTETRRLLADAMGKLPPRLQNILTARANGETFEAIGAREGVSKQAAMKLAENAMKFVRARLKQAGVKSLESDGVLASSPAEDEQAIAELMRDLARDVPTGAIDSAARDGANEPPGNQTVGNPDLANPAGPDAASRKVMNAVDEARKETMDREEHEGWRAEAVAMLERDRAGVLRELLAKADDPENNGLMTATQVKAAQILVNDLIQKAVATKDPQAMRDAQILAWSYREGGTEQARAFAARRDPFKKPADRYREFLAGAVFTPTPALRKQLAQTWSPADKQRRIARLAKQLADARAQIPAGTPANAIPADAQKRISALNRAIGEAKQQKDRLELLNTSLAERMQRIEAEFAKMGVTLDDMFAGDAYLRLRGQKIDNNIFDAANYSAIKRRALSLIKKGWSNDYIAKKTGLDAAQVDGFYQEHVAALRERLAKLGDAALDPNKLDTLSLASASARLASAEAGLSAAERAARIEQMIAAMGYARNDVREKRTRRAPPARRNPKPTATPAPRAESTATEPGALPTYPDATGRPADDFGNRNLGLGEDAAAQPPGATLPTDATGRPADDFGNRNLGLGEDAAAQPPGATLPTDATGRPNPYDFANDESAPPAFDISDPVQVAQAVRTIQAIDGNGFDMVSEYWVNSVLSGPLTQGANIIGNSANTLWDFTFKRAGEAALNSLVQNADAPQAGEFKHMLRAMQPALARAWRNALRTWTAESPMFENDVLNQQLDLSGDFEKGGSTRSAIPGRTGQIVRTPGRLLMATDDFFKMWIAHVEASAQGYRIAKAEGLTGRALEARIAGLVNLPGSAAWLAAVTKAQELTFQSKHEGTGAGRLLQTLGNLRELDMGGGVKPLRFVFPFVRTPFNIFAQGLRQSPAGMALLLGRFARAGFYRVKDGRPIAQTYPQPEMIKHTVEQLIAWTATALLYGAAAGDDDDEDKPVLITGSIPYKDAGSNALNQRTARTPYTVRIGDTMVSYGRIEPAATILGTAVDMIAAAKRSRREKDQFDALGALMQSIGQQAEEKTFLRGIGDIVGAVKGERKGERANYAAQFLSSFVPNLIRQPLAKLDPNARDRTGGFGERLASSIVPQLAEPKIDAYGEKIAQPGLAGWRALVPIAVRETPEVNRVDRLLTNWNQAHPDDDWAPVPLNRTLRLNAKTSRQMTAPELRDYAMRSGRMAAQMLRNAALNIEKPTPDDMKRVKAAFSTARTITRRQMFGATAQEIDTP